MKLNWANKDTAIGSSRNNYSDDRLTIIYLHIEDVFDKCGKDFKLDLSTSDGGENAIGNRLERAKEHFQNGEPMNIPEIGYNSYFKTIDFGDGRHRTMAAYQLGEEYVPAFVMKQSVEIIKSLVRHKEMETPALGVQEFLKDKTEISLSKNKKNSLRNFE